MSSELVVKGAAQLQAALDQLPAKIEANVMRGALRARILQALPAEPYAGVIAALVMGDQRAIEQSDWTIFNRTGIGHLVSISGLHITMVAALFAGLVNRLWRCSFFTRASLPLWLPAQKAAALAGLLAALCRAWLPRLPRLWALQPFHLLAQPLPLLA